jgi:flagellar hook-associated protein 3 FlgL
MQIGTSYTFDRSIAQMRTLSDEATRLQNEIATGKRLTSPSVDPLAFNRVQGLDRGMADDTQFASNVALASSLLTQADGALESVETQLQRARELALRASNDTLSPTDRAAIAVELNAIVDDLFTIANGTDVRGTALFGGASAGTPFVRDANGVISFAGQGEAPPIPIARNATIAASDSGGRIFGNIEVGGQATDIFAIVSDLAAALSADSTATAAERRAAIDTGIAGLSAAGERIGTARASVGARGARLELETERLATLATENKIQKETLEGVDLQTSIAQLQQTMLTLQATQASFARMSQLSLFDMLR